MSRRPYLDEEQDPRFFDAWLDEEDRRARRSAEAEGRALLARYPTCPCPDPACTGGKR